MIKIFKILIFLIPFLLILSKSKSQSSIDSSNYKISFDVEMKQLFYHWSKNLDAIRYDYGKPYIWTATDNPFYHSATYGIISCKMEFGKDHNLKLYANPVIEHRGWSYGVNDMKNIVFYPQFKVKYNDTLTIKNQEFIVVGKVGDFDNDTIKGSNQFYNLDWQGVRFKVNWKKLYLEYNQIADLSKGIGLNTSEFYSANLGCLAFEKDENNSLDVSLYFNQTEFISFPNNDSVMDVMNYYSIGFNSIWKNGNFKYTFNAELPEIENIKHDQYFNLSIDGWYKKENKNSKIKLNLSAKFYKSVGNLRKHFNFSQPYVMPYISSNGLNAYYYSNTIGRHLYPLKNYYRPASQWAYYTELSRCVDIDEFIFGFEFYGSYDTKLYKKVYNNFTLELLAFYFKDNLGTKYINIYPFYTNYTYFKYHSNLKIGFLITNKIMDLYSFYQTFNPAVYPFFGFSIQKTLIENW